LTEYRAGNFTPLSDPGELRSALPEAYGLGIDATVFSLECHFNPLDAEVKEFLQVFNISVFRATHVLRLVIT
jgi:hypothetical protein